MIKGIFCHDLPVYRDTNGVYCSNTMTDELFARYLEVVDILYVATRVYTISNTYMEAHQEKIDTSRVKFIEFPNLNTPKGFFTLIPKAKKRLKKAISKVDLVFIRGGIIAVLALDAVKQLNKPYLMESAGCPWDEYWNYSIIGKIIAPYMEHAFKKGINNANFVVYVTEKWLEERYPTKGKWTYASNVMLDKLDEKVLVKRLEKIDRDKENNKKTIVIGTTGGIGNKAKGQQYVMRAMANLREQYDIRYELVGGGSSEYLSNVANQCNLDNNVIFKGQLTHEEIFEWLDTLDIYIQPSMQEGLPRSLIEAMSRGCPAIGSTTGGIPELLDDDVIFKRGNVKDLTYKMIFIFNENLSERAQRNFYKAKEYEIDKLNIRRSKLYHEYRDFVIKGIQQ